MPVTEESLLGWDYSVGKRMKILRLWARFQSTRKPQPLRLEPRAAKVPPNRSNIADLIGAQRCWDHGSA